MRISDANQSLVSGISPSVSSVATVHPAAGCEDYATLSRELRWQCDGDPLFRDGADHYQIDSDRFERAARTLAPLAGKTVADIGSFPGYGLWAFRDCARYIGVGKCPDWYKTALSGLSKAEWIDWDFESGQVPETPSIPVDVAVLQEVIEHIRRPRRFLTRLFEWLPCGATFYVTTNNLSYIGYILKQLAGKEIFDSATTEDTVYPGHCTYYSLSGLTGLLRSIGFQTEATARVNFLPAARFYRRPAAGLLKNLLVGSMPRLYATHIEVLCRKPLRS